jgi:hypothetical protein
MRRRGAGRPRKRIKYGNVDKFFKQQRYLPLPKKLGDEVTLYLGWLRIEGHAMHRYEISDRAHLSNCWFFVHKHYRSIKLQQQEARPFFVDNS